MNKQRQTLKKQLDNELKHLTFSNQQDVVDRLQSITWKQKAMLIWNKEIELPLLPIAAICMVICLSLGMKYIAGNGSISDSTARKTGELVKIDGYVYWKDDLEKMVARYEN